MDDVNMIYSEERETYNVFVNDEWYYEGNYEQCCDVADSFYYADDDYYGDDGDADYRPEEEYEYER